MKRDFIDLHLVSRSDLDLILAQAAKWKSKTLAGHGHETPLSGKLMGLIFERASTRTRVSFDVASRQLGGGAIIIDQSTSHLHRGETIADTGRLLSPWMAALVLRTGAHKQVEELAEAASIPVINGLSDFSHPCQVMADLLTLREEKPGLAGLKIAWLGDGCNVANSWLHAAGHWGMQIDLATPESLRADRSAVEWATARGANVREVEDPAIALTDADCVMTDTWTSMGSEGEKAERQRLLAPYQVNEKAMSMAKPNALFLHCLPAYRGLEVTAEVIDGSQSHVWQQADNRLHVQKAIIAWCLGEF